MVRVGWSCLLQGKLKSLTICNNKSVNFIMVFPCRKSLDFCIDPLLPFHMLQSVGHGTERHTWRLALQQRREKAHAESLAVLGEWVTNECMNDEVTINVWMMKSQWMYEWWSHNECMNDEVTMNVYWIDVNIPVILLLYITYIYIFIDTMTTQYKVDIGLIIILLLSQ